MKLVSNHVGLELNTSGWMYGIGDPSPQPWVIERYIDLGGRFVTVGSDSHRASQIGNFTVKALSLLRKMGIKEVFYCENGSYIPVPIMEAK